MTSVITGKCAALLERHGGLRCLLREYGIVRLLDGALREAWESLGMRLLHWMGRGPKSPYRWLDAILSPTCDYWVRYTGVIAALEQAAPGKLRTVVEVSSGGRGGIAWALPGTILDLCLVDWSAQLLSDRRGGRAWRVCADACRLPFGDNSFDAAISLDTVEHLPHPWRARFLNELRRVAKAAVVVTCPLQSRDGVFQGKDFDLDLQRQIAARKGIQPEWLTEHLQQGHPTPDEILRLLPGSRMIGAQNCGVWFGLATFYQRPLLWVFSGVYYLLAVKKHDGLPPYRRAIFIWKKPQTIVGRTPVVEEPAA